jgi:membrane protein YqaA with SNARE-associated domain
MLKHVVDWLVAFGPLGVCVLAFMDSAGIPVAAGMDVVLILLAVKSPEIGVIGAILAVAGSTIGNLVLFTAARKGGRRLSEMSEEPGRAQRFRNWFERYGMVTVFIPALLPFPMPLKLFVVSAGVLGTKRWHFLSVVILARVIRYGAAVWLGVAMGQQSLAFLARNTWHFALGGVLLFAALYLLVRLNDSGEFQADPAGR